MYSETEDVIRALAENAEGVCRAYLPAGRREGAYWIVGDLQNNPGRSLFVRLTGPTSGPGARGKWQDAAVGLHGDLLDIIRERTGISRFPDLLAEARAHLGRPQPVPPNTPVPKKPKAPGGTPAAAARLSGAVLLPVSYSATRRKVLSSWDRLIVPLPFTRGIVRVGQPIGVAPDADEAELERIRQHLEARMIALTDALDTELGVDRIEPAAELQPAGLPATGGTK